MNGPWFAAPQVAALYVDPDHSGHRSRTPADFAELLLAMARGARVEMAA